jgi:hypothetical protein
MVVKLDDLKEIRGINEIKGINEIQERLLYEQPLQVSLELMQV